MCHSLAANFVSDCTYIRTNETDETASEINRSIIYKFPIVLCINLSIFLNAKLPLTRLKLHYIEEVC